MGNALHRDIKGGEEVIVLESAMSADYKAMKYRVFVCAAGFGMKADTTGAKIFGFYKCDKEQSHIRGEHIDVPATKKHQNKRRLK